MEKGTVKFFNQVKRFGFNKVDGSDKEIFVHKSDIRGNIHENDTVEFEIKSGPKGLNAVNVRVV